MILLPPRSTRTYTLFPYTTLFRSRIDLEPPHVVGGVDFETGQAGPCRRLEALAPGEGRVEPGQRARQRANLADLAAAIGIVGPAQPGFVARDRKSVV